MTHFKGAGVLSLNDDCEVFEIPYSLRKASVDHTKIKDDNLLSKRAIFNI